MSPRVSLASTFKNPGQEMARDEAPRPAAKHAPTVEAPVPASTAATTIEAPDADLTPAAPATSPAAPAAAVPASPVDDVEATPSMTAPAPRRRGRPRIQPVGERATLVLWLPVGLRDRLRAATTSRRGATMLTVTLDALEDQADQLADLVAASSPQIVRGKLFEREAPAPEQPGGPKVQVTIRGALPSHLDVIDSLVTSTSATSRSSLVAAALDAYLPKRPRALR